MQFDAITLFEIWSTNVQFYWNILNNYEFEYVLPITSITREIGIYILRNCKYKLCSDLRLNVNQQYKLEELWIEVKKTSHIYVVSGICRHPNQNILDFSLKLNYALQL